MEMKSLQFLSSETHLWCKQAAAPSKSAFSKRGPKGEAKTAVDQGIRAYPNFLGI